MRRTLPILIVFLLLSYKIEAQPRCPIVSVESPSGVTSPGELVVFSATVRPEVPENVEYSWTVNRGQILRGQGTKAIGIDWSEVGPGSFAATVTVKGLPQGCTNVATEEYSLIYDPGPEKVVEISEGWEKLDPADLLKIKKKLADDPNAQLYIFLYFKRDTPQSYIRGTKKALSGYLAKRKVEVTRIVFETLLNGHKGVAVWFVPLGVDRPTP